MLGAWRFGYNSGMESLLIFGVPALAIWGASVERRCTSAAAQKFLAVLSLVLSVLLVVAMLVGGLALAVVAIAEAVLVVVVEILLASNVIPSVRSSRALFQHLPLDLRVLTYGGRQMYATDVARHMDNATLFRLAGRVRSEKPKTVLSIRTTSFPDIAFKLYPLRAGVALLVESTEELNRLQAKLVERRESIANQNEILRRQRAMQAHLIRQNRERMLVERVEHDLASTMRQISETLESSDSQASEEDRRMQLNLVKVLIAYSKRKGMLTLAAAESDAMSGSQLEIIGRETMADLRSIGIECAVLVNVTKPISVTAVNVVYDSIYDCVISVLPRTDPVMMVFIAQEQDATLSLSVTIECAIGVDSDTAIELIPKIATSTESWTAVQTGIARELEERLSQREAWHSVSLEDGIVNVAVRTSDEPTSAPEPAPPAAPVETTARTPRVVDEPASASAPAEPANAPDKPPASEPERAR